MSRHEEELTADLVFARLEQLRELLRLVEHLREYRPERSQDGGAPPREITPPRTK